MPEEQKQEERPRDEQANGERGEEASEAEKAEKAQEEHEKAQEEMKKLEEMDEPPTNLEDWPDGQAKYVTYGGVEGDHSYAEGPEAKLGPSDLERKRDGSVVIEGEEVDNPDDYKADPIPGGPTDPEAPQMAGERKKREKMKAMYGEEEATTDAVTQADKQRGEAGEGQEGGQEDPDDDTSDDTSEGTSDDTSDDDNDDDRPGTPGAA